MALTFLKADILDSLLPGKKSSPSPETPVPAADAAKTADPEKSKPPSSGAALAKSSKERAEAAVQARLAALRPAPAPVQAPVTISVPRFSKTMRERIRAAQYDKTRMMVGQIEQFEIDQLIDLAAKTRARYISKLLEFGRSTKPLSFAASEEVKGLREQHEEIVRGLDLVREALERGEIEVEGVEPV